MRYSFLFFALFSIICYSQTRHEDGPYKEYYKSGQLKKEGLFKNNLRVSVWKDYYETGQLKKVYTYDFEGHSTGIEENYSQNGNLVSETKRARDGGLIYTRIYDNGNVQLVYSLIPSKSSKKFIKNGGYKEYYENGVLKIESIYSENELQLFWKQYYLTGEKQWEVGYLNGYRQGPYKLFYKNGKIMAEGNHDLDLKSGDEKIYDSIGNLVYTLKYKEGKLKKVTNTDNFETIVVPDGTIEKVPIYPGCENLIGNEARKKCMELGVSTFIVTKFNTTFGKDLSLKGKQTIYVIFTIDETGQVVDIQSRAKHRALEAEAIRVLALLPKLTPGFQFGQPVAVPYSLPIVFVL